MLQLGDLLVASCISRKMARLAFHNFFAFTDQAVPPEGMWDVAAWQSTENADFIDFSVLFEGNND